MASTIKDVARRAGVSTATVSLVLSERPGVRISEATRQRVREAAKDLEFQPNIVARSLISGKSQMIGMIVSNIHTPFISEVIRGVERAAREQRHHVVVCEANGAEEEMDTLRWLRSRGVDGLIMAAATMHPANVSDYVEREKMPLVLVNQDAEDFATAVTPDHAAAGRLAAQLFADAGYRHLGYVGVSPSRASELRAAGFADEARKREIPTELFTDIQSYTPEEVAAAADGLAARVLERGCDAVLCFNDYTAASLIKGVHAAGKRVPEDVAVIGIDNLAFAPLLDPPLASMDMRLFEAGRAAVETVLRSEGRVPVSIGPRFVYRASAGRAGASE